MSINSKILRLPVTVFAPLLFLLTLSMLGAMLFSMVLLAPNVWSEPTDTNSVSPDPVPVEQFQEEEETTMKLSVQSAPILLMSHIGSHIGTTGGTWTAQGPGPTTNAQVQNLSPNNEVEGRFMPSWRIPPIRTLCTSGRSTAAYGRPRMRSRSVPRGHR